jgi:formiminotetrahydrofolate cyclodeaminase
MLTELTLAEFARRTAERAPLPGGGCSAALAGALAASLAEMAGRFTLDRGGYEDREAAMRQLVERAAACRNRLLAAVQADAEAYGQVLAAYRLPRESQAQQAARAAAVEAGLKQAARVPLEVAKAAGEALELAAAAVAQGYRGTLTDGAVGVLLARSAALGALLNVKVNLGAIADPAFVGAMAAEARAIEAEILRREAEILAALRL